MELLASPECCELFISRTEYALDMFDNFKISQGTRRKAHEFWDTQNPLGNDPLQTPDAKTKLYGPDGISKIPAPGMLPAPAKVSGLALWRN